MIHPAALIDPGTRIGRDVTIGAYAIIGPDVVIGDRTSIGPHTVIRGPAVIGSDNRIFQFCSLGDDPQDKKYRSGEPSTLTIGDRNVIREYCTINRGTEQGGIRTVVGNDNWIMAYVHIAHDCQVGDHVVFANHTTLAGHVSIEDHVICGGFTGVHQFCRIGRHSFTAISSVVVKDVPPYLMVAGNTAKPSGLNREGLKRHGFSADAVKQLRHAYKIVYRERLTVAQALKKLQPLAAASADVACFADFIAQSSRGIVR